MLLSVTLIVASLAAVFGLWTGIAWLDLSPVALVIALVLIAWMATAD